MKRSHLRQPNGSKSEPALPWLQQDQTQPGDLVGSDKAHELRPNPHQNEPSNEQQGVPRDL